jgi:hypothetical protein
MRLTTCSTLPALLLLLTACPPPASEDESTSKNDTSGDGDGDTGSSGDESPQIICDPGETQCADAATLEVCAPTGLEWEPVPCEGYETCVPNYVNSVGETVATCVGPCEQLGDTPSSEGCSFFTTSMYQASLPQGTTEEPPDGIVVGNPQPDRDATVELRWIPYGSNIEQLVTEIGGVPYENPVTIPPGGSHVFPLDPDLTIYVTDNTQETSLFRSGSVYHVVSDLPVVAYLHAPLTRQNTNGSTMLLPENAFTGDYVIYSHSAWIEPNSFTVIALHDQTTVTWTPSVETAGNALPLPFIEAGMSGSQLLNRFDNIRIDTSKKLMRPKCEQDLSGTIIHADKPIWVTSSVLALRLPWCGSAAVPGCPSMPANINAACNFGSDFAMEQVLPLDYWGRHYIGPHAPARQDAHYHWRVFAGQDNVNVTITPEPPNGQPATLAKRGDWFEIILDQPTDLEFDGDGVFMPVQYTVGQYDTTPEMGELPIGSPAMTQMVPTAQFLNRYVFVTGVGYPKNYAQFIRPQGGGTITLTDVDDNVIPILDSDWTAVGSEWEVATVLLPCPDDQNGEPQACPFEASSPGVSDSFGILLYGYSYHVDGTDNSAGYAYMGGMKAEVIYVP